MCGQNSVKSRYDSAGKIIGNDKRYTGRPGGCLEVKMNLKSVAISSTSPPKKKYILYVINRSGSSAVVVLL